MVSRMVTLYFDLALPQGVDVRGSTLHDGLGGRYVLSCRGGILSGFLDDAAFRFEQRLSRLRPRTLHVAGEPSAEHVSLGRLRRLKIPGAEVGIGDRAL